MCPVLQEDILLVAILSHSSMDLIFFFLSSPLFSNTKHGLKQYKQNVCGKALPPLQRHMEKRHDFP